MLEQFLVSQLFAFMLIFCRLGTAIMLLPGFGEAYVTARVRLFLAATFSILLVPVVHLPAVPTAVPQLFLLMMAEIMVGLLMGGLTRFLISTLHMASMIIAYESSLASALTVDIASVQGQDTPLGNLLSMGALVLLFATDLHHMMLTALADSYTLFTPGQFPPINDFADHAARTMNASFKMAMRLAAPNIVIGIITYLGAGILARLMPNLQIFALLQAPNLLISFAVLMMATSSLLLWYIDYFRASLSGFLTP